ncbi:MAG: hypothetical protein ACQEP4_07125 [Bacillota bacterium]
MKKMIIVLLIFAMVFTAGGIFMKYNTYAMGFGSYNNESPSEDYYNNTTPRWGHMGPYYDEYDETQLPESSDERQEDLNAWPYEGYQYRNHPMWGYNEYRNDFNWNDIEEDQYYFRGCRGNFYRDEIVE